ncbi:hypothetical protein [Alkaliphilus sp. B6464]|uniref:hypothetical protein n=1 Tax=Alkaliphilus sp. B6464 TaxID=2731219 RepID=UPI001BADFA64|nr:hypothetical protein [Alkaliphilus sp. B6464]QUH18648.1 hypothetical protein HYG84_01140 [Alkaliphilus sp. B6464]
MFYVYGNDNRLIFFKIKDSKYVDFIKKDNCGVEGENLEHFCIIGTNSVVDVLSPYEPQWYNLKEDDLEQCLTFIEENPQWF